MPLTAQAVQHRLRHCARRLRWSRCASRLVAGVGAALFGLLVFLWFDTVWHLGRAARWTGLGVVLLPLVWGIFLAWRASRQTVSDASMARRLERASPGSHNELINAVLLDRELAGDSPVRGALFAEMDDLFPTVDWSRVFDLGALKRFAAGTMLLVMILLGWAASKPLYFNNSLARIFFPASDIAPLTRTRIDQINPGDTEVTHGDPLTVNVWVSGAVPVGVWLCSREAGGAWKRELMNREVGARMFTREVAAVNQATEYYVAAGDARSAICRALVRPRTAVVSRLSQIQPPAYSSSPEKVVKDSAALKNLLPGSRLSVTLGFNNPVEEMLAADGTGAPVEVTRIDGRNYRFGGLVTASGFYRVRFRDAAMVENTDTITYNTRADEAPKVTIFAPAEGNETLATAADSLTVRFNATDDFGLASVSLYRSTDAGPSAEFLRSWNDVAGKRSFDGTADLPLAAYSKEERVIFCVVVQDGNTVSPSPGRTVSRPIVVTLRSADKLKEQAQEARRTAQRQFDDLTRWQEGNLTATRAAAQNTGAPAR